MLNANRPLLIGCHLSASKGYLHMAKEAVSIGANTFQFFTRNPRGGNAKSLDTADTEAFRTFAAANAFGQILAHAPTRSTAAPPILPSATLPAAPSPTICSGWRPPPAICTTSIPAAMSGRASKPGSASLRIC